MADDNQMSPGDPDILKLRGNKTDGYNYRFRRHEEWNENYLLYRDKVEVNRLTQRQSVTIPLMAQTIRTLLKDVDDMPILDFENLDNDKQAEVLKNEAWKWTVEQNRMELQDIIDKKQVFLFGRSFDQMQIVDGKVKMTVQDPMDILVSRYTNPFDLHSSRFLIHPHIFLPLASLKNNPNYDQDAVQELIDWHATNLGLIKAAENSEMLAQKNEKLGNLGVGDIDHPVLGETWVELTLHFIMERLPGEMYEKIHMYVEADNYITLRKAPLNEVIGNTSDDFWLNHFPYNSWADDIERQDFWNNAVGDIVRPSAKILNIYYSQMIENRVLRSFGMNYYDSTTEGFNPQTYQPTPFGWYGMPGKPADIVTHVDIPDLAESIKELEFVMSVNEKASGATATQQGVQTETSITLGEVQLALQQAQERIKGMSKFYTQAWKDRGTMFCKLIEAAPDKIDMIKIFRKGRFTSNIFSRDVEPKHYLTKSGYNVRVWSQEDKNNQDTQALQKWNAVRANMPDNPKVQEIYDRKLVEFAGATPDEAAEIMQFEEEKIKAQMSMVGNGIETPGMPTPPTGPNGAPAKPTPAIGAPTQPAPAGI